MRLNSIRLGTLLCVLMAGCGTDEPTGPRATSIVLNFESLTLQQLDSAQLVPSFVDSKGTLIAGVPTTFASSDPAILSVSNVGVIRSLGPAGNATVTVRGANLSKTVPVTVQGVASKLVVTPNPGVIQQKGTLQLVARLLDRVDAPIPNATFAYQSSNPAIATVSATGLVTSVGPAGNVSITVRSGAFATTAQVAVTQVPTSIRVLASSPLRIGVNRSVKLPVVVLDAVSAPIAGQVLAFTSLNPSLVTVSSDGTITSVGPLGAAEIRIEVLGSGLTTTFQVQVVTASSPTGTVVDTVPVSGGYAVALTATGRAFVVGPFGDAVASVDLLTRTATPVTWGKSAYAIAVSRDQRRAYLTTTGGSLRDVDLASGTFTDTQLGFQGFGLALSLDGRFAYVGTDTDRFLIVDLGSKAVSAIQVPVPGLHITLDQSGRYAYVSWDSDVAEIDLTSRQMTRRFSVIRGHATALAPGSRMLYVGTQNGAVHRIDLDSGLTELFKATPTCGSWGLGVTPDERFLYLACSGEGRVDVMDIASRQVVQQYTGYGEPRRVAVSDDGTIVAVATMSALAIFR